MMLLLQHSPPSTPLPSPSSFRNILEDSERPPIMVESISETTFKLTDGVILPSNSIFLNGTAFMWDTPPPSFTWNGWNKEHFELFELVTPKPGGCAGGIWSVVVDRTSQSRTGTGLRLPTLSLVSEGMKGEGLNLNLDPDLILCTPPSPLVPSSSSPPSCRLFPPPPQPPVPDSPPDILILGTGRTVLPAPAFLSAYLGSLGIQLDVMDSVSTGTVSSLSLSTRKPMT